MIVSEWSRDLLFFARLSSPKRFLLWSSVTAVALHCVYVGNASARYYYHHNALYRNQAQSHLVLPKFTTPTSQTRLLVFAPHCDDDILGCAGIIRETLQAGGFVRVVTITNGDGFRTAVQQQEKRFRVEPKDFVRFAEQRQQESIAALENLGLEKKNIAFLGYPDRGLLAIWNDHWSPKQPFTSRYTRCTQCPYPNAPRPSAVYCGESILEDVEAQLEAFRPTQVMVTHPSDDHGDHAAAAAFVQKAFRRVQQETRNRDWAATANLSFYLIHRGEWPPKNSTTLLPPPEMAPLDTEWRSLVLSPAETTKKRTSLAFHSTQLAMSGGFLTSFVRSNEIFGELKPFTVPVEESVQTRPDQKFGTVLLSPISDNLIRSLQGGGDIKAISAYRDAKQLHLKLEMRQSIARQIRYVVRLRAFDSKDHTTPRSITLFLNAVSALKASGISKRIQGNTIELDIPLSRLETRTGTLPQTIAISADTYLASLEIDKTGIRFMDF